LVTAEDDLGLEAYKDVLRDPAFLASLAFSLRSAIITIIVSTGLIVPAAYCVHLKLPRLRPVVEFLTMLPLVVPPIVLVVGLLRGFRWSPSWFWAGDPILIGSYVVLSLPYVYRSIDAGLRAIDTRTLTEAAENLGAGWFTILLLVILPNLWPSLVSAACITLAIVMGEFTIALLLQFTTYAVYMSYVWESRGTGAAALSIISFLITWLAMLGFLLVGKRLGRDAAQIGGTR